MTGSLEKLGDGCDDLGPDPTVGVEEAGGKEGPEVLDLLALDARVHVLYEGQMADKVTNDLNDCHAYGIRLKKTRPSAARPDMCEDLISGD